jgi:outer membrane receptor protein involved in Fe transport
MKKYYLLLIIVFFVNCVAFSQNNSRIKGKLVDSLTAEPLAFASIRLEAKNQSAFFKGEMADEKGSFQFVGLKDDKYVIRIEYVGYKTKYLEISYENLNSQLDLGAIALSPLAQLLESITVQGIKPNMVATLEKQVFKAEQFEVARGGTAADVLRNIPSIVINAEGEIMMRGSKGFLILVNGKPTQLDAATILAQIPANTIEKVEMITAPSAKYDADGKAGIINIVTKKGTTDGLMINSNLQYGLPRIQEYENAREPLRYGADLSVGYRKGNWDFSSSLNYLKNDIAGQRIGDVNTTRNGSFTSFPSAGERSLRRENYGFRASLGYKPTKADEFNAGLYVGGRNQFRTADILYNNYKQQISNKEILSRTTYFNSNLVLKSGDFKVYNLDYTHKFVDESSLSVSALYENAMIDGYTKNRNLAANNYSDTLQYTFNTGENPLNALRMKLDYEKQLGIGKLSTGYQYRIQTQKGTFAYFENRGNGTPLIINPTFSAAIDVENVIHGVYSQLSGTRKKLEYTTGLRFENAFREFTDDRASDPAVLKLSNLFPSLNLMYNLKSDLRFKAGYSRRVQRSTNNELNPYPEREHSETLEQGDPNIRPEFIGLYETGLTKDFKKCSVYWNIYRHQITDIVNRVNSVYNDTILNRIYTNAGKARLLGTELGLTMNPVKKLKVFLGGNIYNLKIKGALFENLVNVNSRGWVYSINSNINYQITPSLSSQFNLSYLSARNTAQGIDSRFYQPNFSLKKSFKSNITAAIQWQNAALFGMKVNEQRITTSGVDFYTTTNYILERNILLFNLSYTFNKSDKMAKLPTSEFGEREF